HGLGDLLLQRLQQRLLVGEAGVKAPDGDAGPAGDFGDGEGVEALLLEQGFGGGQQAPVGGAAPGLLGEPGPRARPGRRPSCKNHSIDYHISKPGEPSSPRRRGRLPRSPTSRVRRRVPAWHQPPSESTGSAPPAGPPGTGARRWSWRPGTETAAPGWRRCPRRPVWHSRSR